GTLTYNSRTTSVGTTQTGPESGPLNDPTAMLYVRSSDLDATGHLLPGVPIEPLVLRAAAGDCIQLTLANKLGTTTPPDLPGYSTFPMIVNDFNANQVHPSYFAGLHPELLAMNLEDSDGFQIGQNNTQVIQPTDKPITYTWYAGHLSLDASLNLVATPVEFGAVNLMPADIFKQGSKGAVGAMVIEPQGSTWVEDTTTRAQATVTKADGTSFRDFVLITQNDVNLRYASGDPVASLAAEDDPEDTGHVGYNYRTEPHWFRMGYPPETPLTGMNDFGEPITSSLFTKDIDFTNVLSNAQVGGDPQTPIFTAKAGTPIRLRLLHPVGKQRNNIFQLHGHVWEEEPYTTTAIPQGGTVSGMTILGTPVVGSTVIADQPLSTNLFVNNPFSEWQGSQMGVGPSSHFDIIPANGAGGNFKVPGDYLYRTHQPSQFDNGMWGLLRVTP
ncbi:MAG TPA: hypothetical protein VLT16_07190, partial [Candidatus Limnocylindrales bacterium]|nr:hypothetical protein [Candidatus Limnocylindrales bacterium]